MMEHGQYKDDYAALERFVKDSPLLTYAQLDAALVRQVNLFALRENFDFQGLEAALDEILKALPAIKRIFAHPITHLRDVGEIMPVESVRVVNNRTIVHASAHSELWDDITEEGMRPKKLLTVSYEDNYSIYENLAFVRAVDIILHLVRRNIRLIRAMLYASSDLSFNLLERLNHPEYYLAIGKLHIGYVRDYDRYRPSAERCLEKMILIESAIRARLASPIYRRCKKKTGKIALKKTNIFRNHKDYHRIYLLLKWFADTKIDEPGDEANSTDPANYNVFCNLLTLFAAGHFHFTFSQKQTVDLIAPSVTGTFGGWQLGINPVSCGEVRAIELSFFKDGLYKAIILPSTQTGAGRDALQQLKLHHPADEYFLAIPEEPEDGAGELLLSLFDIESFRRIQQILLRGMIYSDHQRDICPFCGDSLRYVEPEGDAPRYECGKCRTDLFSGICPTAGLPYSYTRIRNHKATAPSDHRTLQDPLLYQRYLEAQMHFRNITPIGEDSQIICPRCGKSHVN
jgi:ribosomal protein S27AE